MNAKYINSLLFAFICSTMCTAPLAEKPSPANLDITQNLPQNLKSNQGKYVVVTLKSGKEIKGIVGPSGSGTVRIEKLSGMDYYDALIDVTRISAIAFKVRGFR